MLSNPLPVLKAKKKLPPPPLLPLPPHLFFLLPAQPRLAGPLASWNHFHPLLFIPPNRPQTAAFEQKIPGEDEVLLKARPKSQKPFFLWALVRTFTSSLLMGACFKLIQDLLSFINPQLLRSHYAPSCCGSLLGGGGVAGCLRAGTEELSLLSG